MTKSTIEAETIEPSSIHACWPVAEYFAALPDDAWHQGQGWYLEGKRFESCCIGAHLAFFLRCETRPLRIGKGFLYLDGRNALCDKLGLGLVKVSRLLYAAGADRQPFGIARWRVPPAQVFANLLSIEAVPTKADAKRMHKKAVKAHQAVLFASIYGQRR